MTGLLSVLAHCAKNISFKNVPIKAQETAKLGLSDFFAVSVAGHGMPVAKNTLSYAAELLPADGESVLLGTSCRTHYLTAGLVNATAGHALDFDDVSWSTIGHPSVAVAPVAFALAQHSHASGEKMLMSYVLGVELMHQIARWTMPALSERGWHTTPANGVFGAATAASILLNLSEEQFTHALGIAATRAFGLRANFGSQTKALHAGLCAQTGIECALLAKHGITSRDNAIEATDGYAQCFSNIESKDYPVNLGEFWDLENVGLVIKQYPCCSGTHPTLDVWGEFIEKHHITDNEIANIEAGVSLLGPRELSCHEPINTVQAKFSLEYAIACRLVFGDITIDSFSDEKVNDPRVQSLMKRIHMFIDPELAKLGFIGTAPIRMKVVLKNGSEFRISSDLAQGNPEKPLSESQFSKKFKNCVTRYAPENLTQQWYEQLQTLEKQNAETIFSIGLLSQ